MAAIIAKMPDPILRDKRADLLANGPASRYMGAAKETFTAMLNDMEAALAEGDWVTGPEYGISDAGLIAYIDRLDRLALDLLWADRPRVAAWLAASRARDSFARGITAYDAPGAVEAMRAKATEALPEVREAWGI